MLIKIQCRLLKDNLSAEVCKTLKSYYGDNNCIHCCDATITKHSAHKKFTESVRWCCIVTIMESDSTSFPEWASIFIWVSCLGNLYCINTVQFLGKNLSCFKKKEKKREKVCKQPYWLTLVFDPSMLLWQNWIKCLRQVPKSGGNTKNRRVEVVLAAAQKLVFSKHMFQCHTWNTILTLETHVCENKKTQGSIATFFSN